MCGRARLSSDYSEIKIALKFDLNAPTPNFKPDWNKPPTEPMLVAIKSEDGKRIPKMMRWGLQLNGYVRNFSTTETRGCSPKQRTCRAFFRQRGNGP